MCRFMRVGGLLTEIVAVTCIKKLIRTYVFPAFIGLDEGTKKSQAISLRSGFVQILENLENTGI